MFIWLLRKLSLLAWGSVVVMSPCDDQRKCAADDPSANETSHAAATAASVLFMRPPLANSLRLFRCAASLDARRYRGERHGVDPRRVAARRNRSVLRVA